MGIFVATRHQETTQHQRETCGKDICSPITDIEKRLSLKICKELPEGLEAFIQRKMGGEGKAERIVRKMYVQTMPNP